MSSTVEWRAIRFKRQDFNSTKYWPHGIVSLEATTSFTEILIGGKADSKRRFHWFLALLVFSNRLYLPLSLFVYLSISRPCDLLFYLSLSSTLCLSIYIHQSSSIYLYQSSSIYLPTYLPIYTTKGLYELI